MKSRLPKDAKIVILASSSAMVPYALQDDNLALPRGDQIFTQ